MKKLILLFVIMTLTLALAAQNNYSPCYTNNMSKGNTAFSQGKYSEAKTYYATAKQCAGGNPSAAQQKINACDAKLKAQKEAAEAKRRAEAEAAEAKRKAEEKAEEAARQAEAARIAEEKRLALCPRTVTDYDGNMYNTIYIGTQCWMAENLRTTHYANGANIAIGSTGSRQSAYRYYPGNSSAEVRLFGYLYNWPAVMHGSLSSSRNPSRVQGVCPYGWHVPSSSEWEQLTDYLESQEKYRCNGSKSYIAKSLASTEGWGDSEMCGPGAMRSTNTCSVSNNPTTNNISGFSVLPAGSFYLDSYFTFGNGAFFWSATEMSEGSAHNIYLRHDVTVVYKDDGYNNKHGAFSVRCIRD